MWDGINRRRFPRAKYPCKVRVLKKNSKDILLTQTENIGVGGICVVLEKELPLFCEVSLELDFEDGLGLVKSKARIVWVVKRSATGDKKHQFDTGIEFASLKSEDKKRIEQIMQKALALNPPEEK